MKRTTLKNILWKFETKKGITPQEVEFFLNYKHSTFLLSALKLLPTISVPVSGAIAELMQQKWNINGPEMDYLYHIVNGAFKVTGELPDSAYLIDIIPFLFAIVAVASIFDLLVQKNLSKRVQTSTTTMREIMEKGELAFDMKPGHSAVFAGEGDYLAHLLQATLPPEEAMYYCTQRPEGNLPVWQHLDPESGEEGFGKVLQRADFKSAGEVMLFPVKEEEMFLPNHTNKNSHDMELADISANIAMIDRFCEQNNLPLKPIFIVGSKQVGEHYKSTHEAKETMMTLEQVVDAENEKRKGETRVTVVDPTEIIMEALKGKIGKKKVAFHAKSDEFEHHKDLFVQQAKKHNIEMATQDTPVKELVNVHFNTADRPSVQNAGIQEGENIVILLDPNLETLAEEATIKENILVVPKMVNEELKRLALET